MAAPSDVAGSTRQGPARQRSLAFYEHQIKPDGIIYTFKAERGHEFGGIRSRNFQARGGSQI